ncbi:MAG: Maf family protein [Candidatus Aureabacteria bacterium]|nr:Maf family protein [Candidatus Auribacterota bacterium]
MKRIILASRSRARRELLRQIGLRFSVVAPRVKEWKESSGNCSDLVVRNALRKARDVARRKGSGIVISADTVVRVGRNIVGKPRDVREALATLKTLSRRPQWVYTGIAVIDIDRRDTYTAYERTKIWMAPMSEEQIRNYFKKVSPLHLAGSFDAQGRGAIFIDRIEGCFYNVVGLPLAKLAKILRKIGVEI